MSESKKTVFVVGLGPGGGQFLTVQAQSALQQAEVLCGYTVYLDLVRPCSSCPSGVATLTVTSMPSAASWRESSRPSVVPLKTTTFIGGTPAA